jgi:hypothetical protein
MPDGKPADNIQLGSVMGNQVVVGKTWKDGDLGLYFPTDGQLSEEFAQANDLVERKNLITGKREGGFFGPSRKVRTQKFKGEKSDGFFCETKLLFSLADEFKRTGATFDEINGYLNEGFSFDTIGGVKICNKYYTPATLRRMNAALGKATNPERTNYFRKHIETEQLFRMPKIPSGALVTVTEKYHGTSGRLGRHKIVKDIERWKIGSTLVAWWNAVCGPKNRIPVTEESWEVMNGTRNTVVGPGHADIYRKTIVEDIVLRKGETIYYEIVGFEHTGKPIMIPHHASRTKDKEVKAKYGDQIVYSYGQQAPHCKMYVYRITMTNEDGVVTELPWSAVKDRSAELGLETVHEIASFVWDPGTEEHEEKNLLRWCESWAEGSSVLDQTHPKEGVCVRVEYDQNVHIYKAKSFLFKVLEGLAKEDEDYVDAEEIS